MKQTNLVYDFWDGIFSNFDIIEGFDYVVKNSDRIPHSFGYALYLVITAIMGVNLLIAILTNIYDILMGKSQGMYMRQIIIERPEN